jgi:hypothetical protein
VYRGTSASVKFVEFGYLFLLLLKKGEDVGSLKELDATFPSTRQLHHPRLNRTDFFLKV